LTMLVAQPVCHSALDGDVRLGKYYARIIRDGIFLRILAGIDTMKRTADSLLAAVRTGNRSQIGDRVPDRTRWLWLPPSITVTGTGSLSLIARSRLAASSSFPNAAE
jgi:hypothetical protein